MINIIQRIFDFYIINFHNKRILKLIDTQNLNTIVDIGCHKAELLQTLIKEDIVFTKYVGFEPVTELFNKVKSQFDDNKNTQFFNLALSNQKGKREISRHIVSSISSFSSANKIKLKYRLINIILKFNRNLFHTEMVKTDKLDNLRHIFTNKIDLLKIDVEGHEPEVLDGSTKLLIEKKPKYIIVELQKKGNYLNYDPINVTNVIQSLNYVKVKSINGPLFLFKDVVYKIN